MTGDVFGAGKCKELYDRISDFIKCHGMDGPLHSGVVIGLSGGADSVFLLHFLKRYLSDSQTPIVAVHINHLIRGEEAIRDEEFSRDLCGRLGVDFICERVDVLSLAKELSLGVEECARNVRYSKFNEIIQGRNDVCTIAVAHNSTDNAETILLNMLRGAGSRGCAGIPPVRDNICRPILCVSKEEIVSALKSSGVDFVVDSTNNSIDYSRNYVRHEILPKLSRLAKSPEKMLSRLSDNLRCDDDYITSVAEKLLSNGRPLASDLRDLHPAVFARVLNLMIGNGCGLSSSCISDIKTLLAGDNFKYSLYSGKQFICERGVCYIASADSSEIDYHCDLIDCKAEIGELNSLAILSNEPADISSLNVYKKSIQASLGSAIINGRLYFRPKRDGDKVYYGGITHKLKKLYNDRKIPPSQRNRVPVLCDDSGVVWVPGFGVRDDKIEGKGGPYVVLCSNLSSDEGAFLSGFDFK